MKPTLLDKMANNSVMMNYQNALSERDSARATAMHEALIRKKKKRQMIAMKKKNPNLLADGSEYENE